MKRIRLIFALAIIAAVHTDEAHCQSPHGITFNYVQSVTAGITGNNLYCGTVTGVYPATPTMTSATPVTSFNWTAGTPGTKYFCVVTAVAAGIESAPSNEVSVTFPVTPQAPTGLVPTTH